MNSARVLIADGDRRFRSQLYTRLLDLDLFSDCVATANDAVEYLRDRTYGLVIVDLELPNGEGYAVLDELRLVANTSRPMVLVTASRDNQASVDPDLVQIIMRKPVRLADVADMIRSCVGSTGGGDSVSRAAKSGDGAIDLSRGDQNGVGIVS